MLVLSRQRNEEVVIGDDHTAHVQLSQDDWDTANQYLMQPPVDLVMFNLLLRLIENAGPIIHTTVDIRGEKVRQGFEVPKGISVHRREVYEAIKRENRAAAQLPAASVGGVKVKS